VTDVENLLAKARWRQELNKRGYEGRLPVSSERLSEALRTELRAILDNDGKPFDLQVARHVYDFAIAAKDLLTVSVKSVEDAMRVVADNNGAMESLIGADDPQPPEQISETFGARMLRELLATLPVMLRKNNEDLHALVGAIADARDRGMLDIASKLEQRLLGTPLEPSKITRAEIVHDSFEHGFIDGSMQDNFDRGTINGHVSRDEGSWSPAYREGYEAGQARRALKDAAPPPDVSPPVSVARPPRVRSPPSVRGIDICAGCGSRECFNVCCHPSNNLRESNKLRESSNGRHILPSGDAP
jgi:hypothetical protein